MTEEIKEKKTLVLLDSHAIIHRAYHALPDFMSSKGEPTGALYGLANMLMKIIEELKPDHIVACYDLPGKTFRHESYDDYKAGRAKADDALVSQLQSSRDIFEAFNIPIYDSPGFEADDILGTIVEKVKNDKDLRVIVASGDMDTMQLVDDKKVQVYTLKKGINDTILYDEEKVVERFGFAPEFLADYKGLRGDPSDNIVGVKGVGEKTATTLVKHFGSVEKLYENIDDEALFKKLGITPRIRNILKENEEEALFSKTLATIRRDAPIKFTLSKKTFWQTADLPKIEEMFSRFEFRSLFSRLKRFFSNGESVKELDDFTAELSNKEELATPDDEEVKKTALALWLVNSEISNPTLEDIEQFGGKDFEKAKKEIFEKLENDGLEKVYEEIELPIMERIEEMQKRGILIDQKYFAKLSKEYHKDLDKLTKEIHELAGVEFNINSPKQLGEVLFEKLGLKTKRKKTASGNYSTKISVLEELVDEHPIIQKVMDYRELQKLVSTYIDTIPKMVGDDGRLHAKFLQASTTTGRFSSVDPNLQNLPIKSDLGRRIRNGFVAESGHKLLALDYSQVELRTVAMLSEDKNLTEIFREGKDVHAGVASFVFGVPIEEVDREMRRKAKVINFGIIYGMGVTSLRKNLGDETTRAEAQKFYDNYFRQFSGVRDYLEGVKEFAKEHGYTQTLFGRRRYFKDINSRLPFLRSMAERTAINAPVQGTAADIIKLAIRFAHEDLNKAGLIEKAHLVLQIHDELVYEVEDSVLEQATEIIKKAMTEVLERSYINYKTDIPLLVHAGAGENFGEVK